MGLPKDQINRRMLYLGFKCRILLFTYLVFWAPNVVGSLREQGIPKAPSGEPWRVLGSVWGA